MKMHFITLFLSVLLTFSCGSKEKTINKDYNFPMVSIPPMYKGDQERALKYLVGNYWNNFLGEKRIDSIIKEKNNAWGVLGLDTIKFEQAYGEYSYFMNILQPLDYNIVSKSMTKLMERADEIALRGDSSLMMSLIEYNEKYFYDPNSPVLNEEIYIPALEALMEAKSISDLDKMSYEWQLKMSKLNREGQVASDFTFRERKPNGTNKDSKLSNIKGDYTLIYFNNPDCPICVEYKELMLENPQINELVKNGKMKILAMYTDEDIELWKNKANTIPKEWINAYDPNFILRENELFSLRAVPSLYLLDKDKKVILKDAKPDKVFSYLAGKHQ